MENNIVHIGYHKTATTWFQKSIYPNVKNAEFIDPDLVRETFITKSAFKFDPGKARESLGVDGRRFVICEESLSGDIQSGGLHGCLSKDIADRLYRTLGPSEIVIFIRNQLDMIAATYKQYLRNGGTHRPQRYLFPGKYKKGAFQRPHRLPLFSFDHFEYEGLIRHYKNLFGIDRVHVFLYESLKAQPVKFIESYADQLNLDIDVSEISADRKHTSYKSNVIPLARLINHFTDKSVVDKVCWLNILSNRQRKRALEYLNNTRISGYEISNKDLLGGDAVEYIMSRYKESNKRISNEFNLPLECYGYTL